MPPEDDLPPRKRARTVQDQFEPVEDERDADDALPLTRRPRAGVPVVVVILLVVGAGAVGLGVGFTAGFSAGVGRNRAPVPNDGVRAEAGGGLKPGDADMPGSVHGNVFEGDVPQEGLTVEVFGPNDAKARRGIATTGAGGAFEVTGLSEGNYFVQCRKGPTGRVVRKEIALPAGTPVGVRLDLIVE